MNASPDPKGRLKDRHICVLISSITELANRLWRKICRDDAVAPLTPDAERLLQRHSWPGNARELHAILGG